MKTKKRAWVGVAAITFIAGTAAYAVAQQHPAHENGANAGCPHECTGECMAGGGMMGGGMHGDKSKGMMNGMAEGASCPMMQMRELANVQIENTKSGAVIRMNAKNTEQVAELQKLAQRMTQCMSHAEAAPSNPTAPPKQTH